MYISLYLEVNISEDNEDFITDSISSLLGQISLKKIFLPDFPRPI